MVISMLKIRRPLGRLIFNMGIAIPGKTVFLIETAPRIFQQNFLLYLIYYQITYFADLSYGNDTVYQNQRFVDDQVGKWKYTV